VAEKRERDRGFSEDLTLRLSSFINVSDPSPVCPFVTFSFSGSAYESDIDSWCGYSLLKEMDFEAVGRDDFVPDMIIFSEKVCLLGDPRASAPVLGSRGILSLPAGPSRLYPWGPIAHAAGLDASIGRDRGGGGEKDLSTLECFIQMSSRGDPEASGECTMSSRRRSADIEWDNALLPSGVRLI
jgi:hypothetical protein